MRARLDYLFVREFPQGNHGRVFMARAPARLTVDDEHVAVKVLARSASDESFERLANEVRLFASVRSPHLVDVHEAGREGSLLYYSMEYFAEGSLGIRRRDFTREDILAAVAHAARAAQALHDAGVVHADIKPNNILLRGRSGKLGDLGLAQQLADTRRVSGSPIGSVEYMDPGIVVGEPTDPASDVWALGATLHWALTGRGLYGRVPAPDLLTALRHVANSVPQPAPELGRGEAELIRSCLAPHRVDRPSAADVAARLEELLAAEPAEPSRPASG